MWGEKFSDKQSSIVGQEAVGIEVLVLKNFGIQDEFHTAESII